MANELGWSMSDGPHRLRNLARAESVYELQVPGIERSFPPLRSLQLLPNNLPIQLSSFVGREIDIAKVEQLVSNHCLVTLVGAGGVGKTRIALAAIAALGKRDCSSRSSEHFKIAACAQ
ncbi:MAG: hypothetical protein ACXWMY_18635 [Vulcanimicrobiaceae bacterium]